MHDRRPWSEVSTRVRDHRCVPNGRGDMRRFLWVSSVAMVVASVVVPATAGAATSKNNSDPSEGVTPTSVTVGGVMVASGEGGFSEAGALIGFKAYINTINASGGVNGR